MTASKASREARVASTLPPACAMRAKIVRHLRGRLARGKDHLGHAGAQGAVVIELGKAHVFKGQVAQAVERVIARRCGLRALHCSSASICERSISAPPFPFPSAA